MKEFFKALLSGMLCLFYAVCIIAALAGSAVYFYSVTTATGFAAVEYFVLALLVLSSCVFDIYVIGDIRIKAIEADKKQKEKKNEDD